MQEKMNLAVAAENSVIAFERISQEGHEDCTGKGCVYCFQVGLNVYRTAVKAHIIRNYATEIQDKTKISDLEHLVERLMKIELKPQVVEV